MSNIATPPSNQQASSQDGQAALVGVQNIDPGSDVLAASARTLTRALGLYFSRPVRLFRPAKVTGWQFLRNMALREGASLTPAYVLMMCRKQGVWVVPKHFLPPLVTNAALGTILWSSYGFAHDSLGGSMPGTNSIGVAALAGGFAGGCQALAAAPAENVRLLLEGGSAGHSWGSVWKEVFRSRVPPPSTTVQQEIHEIRELRNWLKDVREMAGRGWDGWRWGCAKDVCAFGAFFAVFEITRQLSSAVASQSSERLEQYGLTRSKSISKVLNACTLVTGGVIAGLVYESVSRPFDRVRRIVETHSAEPPHSGTRSMVALVREAIRQEGLGTLYREPVASVPSSWLVRCGRTLARVGPWGIGFLVWESYGSGLNLT
ncbi:hypothetical protein BKA70DRAFT_1136913 [Coprinopsis sp. MPI-PUGE-AT-0042]|nr:hypothetical protein BKA70DRAFT_1136913 [Coprinopsis sp. MPI-PUGE-AT-0042]